jgi:hypothetical protein
MDRSFVPYQRESWVERRTKIGSCLHDDGRGGRRGEERRGVDWCMSGDRHQTSETLGLWVISSFP